MLRFWRLRRLQTFAAVHASAFHHVNQEHSLSNRNLFKERRTAARAGCVSSAPPASRLPGTLRLARVGLTRPFEGSRGLISAVVEVDRAPR